MSNRFAFFGRPSLFDYAVLWIGPAWAPMYGTDTWCSHPASEREYDRIAKLDYCAMCNSMVSPL